MNRKIDERRRQVAQALNLQTIGEEDVSPDPLRRAQLEERLALSEIRRSFLKREISREEMQRRVGEVLDTIADKAERYAAESKGKASF